MAYSWVKRLDFATGEQTLGHRHPGGESYGGHFLYLLFCQHSHSDLRKDLSSLWVCDTVVAMTLWWPLTTVHIHSGLHSLKASSATQEGDSDCTEFKATLGRIVNSRPA